MSIATVLREKRKALGLTQEQVAARLGVSAPAVNKWENGVTCPDLLLLPALARLLKTDPNTLLDYQSELTHQEALQLLQEIGEVVRTGDVAQSFAAAEERLKEYPYCAELLQSAATMLSGKLMMSALPEAEQEPYRQKVTELYRRVAESGDTALANQANYMLACGLIREERYTEAQALLDALPDWNALDKRGMQADVLDKQGQPAKAAELLERKLTLSLQDQQATLCRLIRLAVNEGDNAGALALADCARRECAAFGLGEYWENIAPLEAAVALRDVSGAVEALSAILRAAAKPWNALFSPLFRHLPHKNLPEMNTLKILSPLLRSLKDDPKYAFLADAPAYQALVRQYGDQAGEEGGEALG